MANYRQYSEIYGDVCRAMGDLNNSRATEVKAVVNMVYLNEVLCCDDLYPLFWLMECDDSKKGKVRATITGITAATPPVVTAVAHGFDTGDVVTIYGVSGMTEVNYRTFRITKLTADTFQLMDLVAANITGAGFTAWTSGGYAHHRGTAITACKKIYKASWYNYNKSMSFVGIDELEDTSTLMADTLARPQRCMHRKAMNAAGTIYDYLFWYNSPEQTYNARIWYEKFADRLSADGDIPILPPDFHDILVSGSVSRLIQYSGAQVENAIIWPQLYKQQTEALKSYNREWWRKQGIQERSAPYLA
jgi:hypothetical protein